jgi:hypothetical protein
LFRCIDGPCQSVSQTSDEIHPKMGDRSTSLAFYRGGTGCLLEISLSAFPEPFQMEDWGTDSLSIQKKWNVKAPVSVNTWHLHLLPWGRLSFPFFYHLKWVKMAWLYPARGKKLQSLVQFGSAMA